MYFVCTTCHEMCLSNDFIYRLCLFFMVLVMYVLGILCVILFYFMDYHLSSIAMSF